MMFWVGLLIALVSGVLSVGLSRQKVQHRHPAIKNWHLDTGALGLLVLGLMLSAVDHRASERQVSSLRSEVQRVHSFEVTITATTSASWKTGRPPDLIPLGFDQTKPIAALDLQIGTSAIRRLELIPWLVPKLSPAGPAAVTLLLHLRPKPDDWVYATQLTDLVGITGVEFGAWGLTSSLTTDGRLHIVDVNLDILVNSRAVAQIRKIADKWIELSHEPTHYGTLSWKEFYPFQHGV